MFKVGDFVQHLPNLVTQEYRNVYGIISDNNASHYYVVDLFEPIMGGDQCSSNRNCLILIDFNSLTEFEKIMHNIPKVLPKYSDK